MARSFGRQNTVNRDMFAYNTMLLGESGCGKTTMIAEVMRKFCKPDEYIVLQIGKEEGCKAINGLMWDQIDTWKQFVSFVDEVVTQSFAPMWTPRMLMPESNSPRSRSIFAL